MKRLLIPLLSLSILGAGCAATPSPAPQPEVTKPATTAPTTSSESADADTQDGEYYIEPDTLTPATTDATWKTYTNTTLGFSFLTPTKGRYAPQWEVKVFKDTDAEVKDICYTLQNETAGDREGRAQAGSVSFCHTSASEGAAGSTYFTDAYATDIGHSVAVLLFTKRVTNGGIIPNCSAQYSSVSTACVPFVQADYEAAVGGIVGTFQLTK